jgi:hypothetical protein
LFADKRHRLEIAAAFAAWLQTKALELTRDVFSSLEVADRSRLAAAHGIVGYEKEPQP